MIPHERSLVEKFKNRPFVLIGVNSDGTNEADGLAKYKKQAEEMGVTWRSFQNESVSPQISETWRVQGWPTLVYIDHKGVIREKNHGSEELEAELEKLIALAEADAKKPAEKPAEKPAKKPAGKK